MKGTTYLDNNTTDGQRADITITLTATETNRERRLIHYRNKPFYEKFFNLEPHRVEYREAFVGIYNCLASHIPDNDFGSKIFTVNNFPQEFLANDIHSWLRTEFEIVDHYPRITAVTITGADDFKFMDVSCHFIELKREDRSRG